MMTIQIIGERHRKTTNNIKMQPKPRKTTQNNVKYMKDIIGQTKWKTAMNGG